MDRVPTLDIYGFFLVAAPVGFYFPFPDCRARRHRTQKKKTALDRGKPMFGIMNALQRLMVGQVLERR
jgi:hypothetical protein